MFDQVVATQICLEFSPRNFGEDLKIGRAYFSDGLVETTKQIEDILFMDKSWEWSM